MKKSAIALAIVKTHHEASTGKVRRRRRTQMTQNRAAFKSGPAAQSAVSSMGSRILKIAPVLASIHQSIGQKTYRLNNDRKIDIYVPVGGGFVPPGADMAKAEPVDAARRAAESASERKVRDIINGSRRGCAPESVTKVQQSGIVELPVGHQ